MMHQDQRRSAGRARWKGAATLLSALAVWFSVGLAAKAQEIQAGAVSTLEGDVAPALAEGEWPRLSGDFALLHRLGCPVPAAQAAFASPDGVTWRLSDFRGQVIVLNFWATWCPPCVAEMPSLDRLQAARDGDVKVIALSREENGMTLVPRFFARHLLTNLVAYMDPGAQMSDAFRPHALPTTMILDRQGDLVAVLEGPAEWDSPQALALLDHIAAGHHRAPAPPPAEGETVVDTLGGCF